MNQSKLDDLIAEYRAFEIVKGVKPNTLHVTQEYYDQLKEEVIVNLYNEDDRKEAESGFALTKLFGCTVHLKKHGVPEFN